MNTKDFMKVLNDIDPEYEGPMTTTEFIDTGSYIFNAAISASLYGGFPGNRITALHSEAGVGKTYFAMSAVKAWLENDPEAQSLYFDTEFALTPEFFNRRSIDAERVHIRQPGTIEDFKTESLKFLDGYGKIKVDNRPKVMMILDSLGMLPSLKEETDSLDGKHVRDMTKAQSTRSTFRTLTQKLGKVNVPLLICAHNYDVIGAYVPTKKMSGGGGVEYACSTICALSKKKDTEEVTVNGKKVKRHDGNIIKIKVDKSRYSREGRTVETRLDFQKGIDRYYGLLDLAAAYDIIKKVSTQYEFPDGSKHYKKNIDANPEKFFTADIMVRLEEAAKRHFSLGSGAVDFVPVESEDVIGDTEE